MSIRRRLEERAISSRPALLASLGGHLLLFLLLILSSYLWAPSTILLGGGPGGGSGSEIMSVGLVEELSGGAGMYKPSIVAQPEVAPPPPKPREVEEAAPEPEEAVFVEADKSSKPKTPDPVPSPPTSGVPRETETNPAAIPQEARPGSGGAPSASLGRGGGQGSGFGLQIGTGSGGPGVSSWYVRQLEQRVGQNWLRTSLQGLNRRVRAEISFEIARSGTIENIEMIRSSGVSAVDQAARRAVLASSPLPPVPVELRARSLRVVAVFEYPPP